MIIKITKFKLLFPFLNNNKYHKNPSSLCIKECAACTENVIMHGIPLITHAVCMKFLSGWDLWWNGLYEVCMKFLNTEFVASYSVIYLQIIYANK